MFRRRFIGIARWHLRLFSVVENQGNRGTIRSPTATELISEFGHAGLITKLFRMNPALEESNSLFWRNFIYTLSEFGFHPRDCFRMISLYPSVLGYKEEKLKDVLNEWQKHSHLVTDKLIFLMLNRPQFLSLSTGNIKRRVPFFRTYCTSHELLMTLLFLCPNVMFDDWQEIIEKLKFLNEEMVVYKTEVINCRALSMSLEHLKMRFSIIEKCGFYKRPNPHLHKQTHKERMNLRNPKLKDITDKSDYSFARKIAKISLEEYEVYADAFSQYEGVDSDMSSDEDSSDEE